MDEFGQPIMPIEGETCFYCGEVIKEDVGIDWWGFGPDNCEEEYDSCIIRLHVNCTISLTLRLLRDVYELEGKVPITLNRRGIG